MKWDFLHRPESSTRDPRTNPCKPYRFELPDGTTLADALAHAYANGLPRGSARCGCIEVQNDLGIYSHRLGNRIDLSTPRKAANVVFKTWEELEREEE